MRKVATITLMAGFLISATSFAAEIVNLENVLETSSDVTPIPLSAPTTFVFKNCPECTGLTLRIDPSTRFFARQSEVSLRELRQLCGARTVGVLVGYTPRTRVVTRFVTSCEPSARSRK